MVNSLKNTTNLREVKTVVKTGINKTMTGLLRGDWKGLQKRDRKFYLVTSTDTAYIPYLSVNIFSMTRALTKGFNVMSEKENFELKKNATILKFEERLYNGNGNGYILAARVYTSPNGARKTHTEGNNPEGKTVTKVEGMASTTENTAIKRDTAGEIKVYEKEMEPDKTTDYAMSERLPYAD